MEKHESVNPEMLRHAFRLIWFRPWCRSETSALRIDPSVAALGRAESAPDRSPVVAAALVDDSGTDSHEMYRWIHLRHWASASARRRSRVASRARSSDSHLLAEL